MVRASGSFSVLRVSDEGDEDVVESASGGVDGLTVPNEGGEDVVCDRSQMESGVPRGCRL